MVPVIKRYLEITALLMMTVCLAAGYAKKGNADLAYSNQRYSYDEKEVFSCDSWTRYDKEYLEKLKADYELEKLVANCGNDFERVQAVTEWVTNLWAHNGDNIPEQNDPLSILHNVTEEGEQYRCVEYGVVISGCLNALGIPTRTLGLKTQDVETREYGAGHVAAEAYIKDLKKWVFIDGQWGIIPVMDGMPLNAVQLSEVLEHPGSYDTPVEFLSFQGGGAGGYAEWISEYLYYFDCTGYTCTKDGLQETSLMLTPADAENPKIFQVNYPLEIDIYTDSVPAFYPPAT